MNPSRLFPYPSQENKPIRYPGLKPGVFSGLILSGAFYPDLKIGILRRERIKTISVEWKIKNPILKKTGIRREGPFPLLTAYLTSTVDSRPRTAIWP